MRQKGLDMTATLDLPHLDGRLWMADGGLETTLLYLHGIDLPDFAAFPLLDDAAGRRELRAYYEPYLRAARIRGLGMVVDTPTWRANPDWSARLGWSLDSLDRLNTTSVDFVRELAGDFEVEAVINGAIGPRGDGYVVGATMSEGEAARYHSHQIRAFADGGADMATAVTMTYAAEAIGVTRAAVDAGLPVAISFTVETDGRLPSGQALGDAIEAVDRATDAAPAYFMVNCAHPSHFEHVLADAGSWKERIRGIRANASRASHAELDEAEELDRGNPAELAADYQRLFGLLPSLALVGGCCGTDSEHVVEMASALATRV
jgi:S-methylmethionine-dependent homocysteine/selenocysteine methylase